MKISTSKNNNRVLLYAFLLSLFWVFFMWRFWRYGIDVLGINSVMYGLGVIGFFWYVNKERMSKKSWLWMAPLIIIVVSLGIYTNPFTKGISLFFLPLLFFVFSTQEVRKLRIWSRSFIPEMLFAFLDYIGAVFLSLRNFVFKENVKLIPNLTSERRSILKQVSWAFYYYFYSLFLLSFRFYRAPTRFLKTCLVVL